MAHDSPWLAIAHDIIAGKYNHADKSTLDSLRFGLQAVEFDKIDVVKKALEKMKVLNNPILHQFNIGSW